MSTDSVFSIAPASLNLGAVLSRGSPGITVYKAELMIGQCTLQVAVKRLCTSGASPALEAAFLKEIHVLQLASGTCGRACRMLGCCKLEKDPCIVMTLYPKSAAKLLEDNSGPVPMSVLISLAVEVLEGLAELHAANIWHLDLKPPNILLDQYGHAYLSDFGISYALRTLEACTVLTATAGTPHYMSPEQTDADFGARGPHTDVWGFAATVLHLATAEHPYRELTVLQMISAMLKAKPPSVPDTLPAWLQHLLKQCFSFDVSKRPPVFQLLQVFKEHVTQGQGMAAEVQVVGGQAQQQNDAAGQAVMDMPHVIDDGRIVFMPKLDHGCLSTILADLQSTDPHRQLVAASHVCELDHCSQKDAIITAGVLPLLVALLRSDQPKVQAGAARALGSLKHGSEQTKDAIIRAGVVPPLVALLRSDQPEVVVEAADALASVACASQQAKDVVIAAGAVPPLLALLSSDLLGAGVERESIHVLRILADASQQAKNVIIAAGAVPPLVALLSSNLRGARAERESAHILRILADASQQAKDVIIAAGAVPPLVALLHRDSRKWQCAAAELLGSLAAGSQQNKDAICAAGAVRQLTVLLMPGHDDQSWWLRQRAAARVLGLLASGCKQSKDAIIAAGAVPRLVALMKSEHWQQGEGEAANALASLADGSQQCRDAIITAGAVPLLVANLRSDQPELQHTAANALEKLAAGSQQNKDMVNAAGAAYAV